MCENHISVNEEWLFSDSKSLLMICCDDITVIVASSRAALTTRIRNRTTDFVNVHSSPIGLISGVGTAVRMLLTVTASA